MGFFFVFFFTLSLVQYSLSSLAFGEYQTYYSGIGLKDLFINH